MNILEPARAPDAHNDFGMLLDMLARPDTFPFAMARGERVTVVQTHASAVLLARDRAYKLKKPRDFGFFDYSTAAQRRHFCQQEVWLNARLAPEVYLGVAPVLALPEGRARFGPTLSPEAAPEPSAAYAGGEVIDYAVVMVRLPDEATLESRVARGAIRPALLAQVARRLATFHRSIPTDEHVASFGQLEVIKGNWEENLAQMRPYVGRALDAATYERIAGYVRQALNGRAPLIASRVRQGRIRDCHGDLRLQHVYALGGEADPGSQLAIIDCIEFNERFRYSDVASEVAFLTMELEVAGRPDLSRVFVDAYVRETGDEALRELLPFYTCYRACVRGKVAAFQLDEPEVPAAQREDARHQAASLFALAAGYATGRTRPILVLVGGLMGTGKSTLAETLHHELGWALLSADATRKRLARLDPAQPQAAVFGQGIYSPGWTAQTYAALIEEAADLLASGRSVLLEATFAQQADRRAAARAAARPGADALFIECVCPRATAIERLAGRWATRVDGLQMAGEASGASDGRPALYDTQAARWEPFDDAVEPGIRHVDVSTTMPLAATIQRALEAVGVPRPACWL